MKQMPLTMEETEFCSGSFSPPPFFFPYKTGSAASLRPTEIFSKDYVVFPASDLQQNCSYTGRTVLHWNEKCRLHPMYQYQMEKGPRLKDCYRSLSCKQSLQHNELILEASQTENRFIVVIGTFLDMCPNLLLSCNRFVWNQRKQSSDQGKKDLARKVSI